MANRSIVDVKNVQWCCPNKDAAYCLVKFSDIDDWLEYTAVRGDEVAHGNELFQIIDRGLAGDIPEYSGPDQSQIEAWNLLMDEVAGYRKELSEILPEVQLGLAAPERVERAKWLYGRIKDIEAYHKATYDLTFCYVNREVP